MTAIWNGDFSTGDLSQWGAVEYGGTFDGTPPLSERITVAKTLDGITPPPGQTNLARIKVVPGDQYGGSSGWRTLIRPHEPIQLMNPGYDSTLVFALLLPADYPGDPKANMWVSGVEVHQTKASYVSVTGPAPFGFRAFSDAFEVNLAGGRDGAREVVIDHLQVAPGYQKLKWQYFVMRYKHSITADGAFSLYHAEQGATKFDTVIEKSSIKTMYEGTQNYSLWGLYRDQVGTIETKMYLSGVKEFPTTAEAMTYAQTFLGTTPPPPPPPTPTANVPQAITDAKNALTHLRASDAYRTLSKGKGWATTEIYKTEQSLLLTIKDLNG